MVASEVLLCKELGSFSQAELPIDSGFPLIDTCGPKSCGTWCAIPRAAGTVLVDSGKPIFATPFCIVHDFMLLVNVDCVIPLSVFQ